MSKRCALRLARCFEAALHNRPRLLDAKRGEWQCVALECDSPVCGAR